MKTDLDIVRILEGKVRSPVHFKMEGDRCVFLDLTSKDSLYGGLVRHHSAAEKEEVLTLIARLGELRYLNLQRNRLYHLPEVFCQLQQLEVLNLGSNYLGNVPPELRFMSKLKHLHLGNNDLTELPDFFGHFAHLEYLTLHKNIRLKQLGSLAGQTELRHLNLHYLNLHRLPDFVYRCKNLVTLTVWNVSEFSDELADLQKLQFFSACGSPRLRRLPAGLMALKQLRMMRLFKNKLESLPSNFGDLEQLEQLSLYQNELRDLPDSFGKLRNLKKLNLGWNHFTSVPQCLTGCNALEWLAIFHNPLGNADSCPLPARAQVLRVRPFTTIPPEGVLL